MELATGAPLFPGESDIDQLWLIIKACRVLALAIANACLSWKPTKGISAAVRATVPLRWCMECHQSSQTTNMYLGKQAPDMIRSYPV